MDNEEYFNLCLRELKKTNSDEEAKAIMRKFSYLYVNPYKNIGRTPKQKVNQIKIWKHFDFCDRQYAKDNKWRYDKESKLWWKFDKQD